MQFQQPQSTQCKIAILIIALVGDVSGIRNGISGSVNAGNGGSGSDAPISAKLKNFFPSEPFNEVESKVSHPQALSSARQSANNGGAFRPSQMLEFTPADATKAGAKRYPPSYLEPNYKYQLPNSLLAKQTAMDKQFAFPENNDRPLRGDYQSTPIPTTPVVSYLDPYTQQNYQYTATSPSPPIFVQYQREEPHHGDQAYTVQSSLLVGSQQHNKPYSGTVDDVYMMRPGYVFDEHPTQASYRRPAQSTSTPANHKISYDSHDYPPPSYASQQTSNFVAAPSATYRPTYHQQDVNNNGNGRPLSGSPVHHQGAYAPLTSSNYANNFGNYLQRPPPDAAVAQHYARPPPPPLPNYYEYQIGEIPPQPPQSQQQQQQQQPQYHQFNYHPGQPAYRPPLPTPSSSLPGNGGGGGGGGLATLASLFTTTQQYAPQFTNLLLGGNPSSSSSPSSSALGSLLGAFTGTQQGASHSQSHNTQHARPPTTQLIRALENIARNDDLQCVPKVLCQMIAGQTLRGQLPGFITSPAITNFLAGFPAASPALIYGRAALLGISGGDRSCIRTYAQCPKSETEIIHYLNNHRGGFFKFFSEPEELPPVSQQLNGGVSGGGTLFSILSALTGNGQPVTPVPTVRPRPTQAPTTDIADGIGSFFTQVLGEYLSGVEYQRRRRRRRSLKAEIKRYNEPDSTYDFHDEEDNLDTQTNVKFVDDEEAEDALANSELIGVMQFPEDDGEGRILHHKDIASSEQEGLVRFPGDVTETQSDNQRQIIFDFNRAAAQRKLRFPRDKDTEQEQGEKSKREGREQHFADGWRMVLPHGLGADEYGVEKRRGKRIVFKDTNEQLTSDEDEEQPLNAVYEEAAPPQRGARVIFPDHYERYIRRGKILNRPTYAPSYQYAKDDDRLVLSDVKRPGSYYRLEHSYDANQHLNRGEYMPSSTVRFTEPNYNYPNSNYVSDNRYSSAYQTATATRRPKYEDDKNIYVNNAHGITEYYIKPDGKKVYLNNG